MNEILFFAHIVVLLIFLLFSLKLGKNSLITFVSLQTIFANLFVTKQIAFFGFNITCSDMYTVSAIFGLNLLQEYFGKDEAKKAVSISFIALLLFMIVAQIHLFYSPSLFDKTQSSFENIFSNSLRIILSSIVVFFISQKFDIWFYGFLKKRFQERSFLIRMGTSALCSQFLDTALFSLVGLWGVVGKVFDIILISFIVKAVTILCASFFIGFTKKLHKKIQNDF
jgi:uncharacterized integral membrane protein (TIGR00697 family)